MRQIPMLTTVAQNQRRWKKGFSDPLVVLFAPPLSTWEFRAAFLQCMYVCTCTVGDSDFENIYENTMRSGLATDFQEYFRNDSFAIFWSILCEISLCPKMSKMLFWDVIIFSWKKVIRGVAKSSISWWLKKCICTSVACTRNSYN